MADYPTWEEYCKGKSQILSFPILYRGDLPGIQLPQLHPETIEVIQAHLGVVIDLITHGDGITSHTDTASLRLTDHPTIVPTDLKGKHCLAFLPTVWPWRDDVPIYSIKSWSKMFHDVLSTTSTDTSVTLVLPSTPRTMDHAELIKTHPTRDFATLRKFLKEWMVLPSAKVTTLTTTSYSTHAHPTPLLVWFFSNTTNFCTLPPPIIVQPSPNHDDHTFRFSINTSNRRHHVIMSGPASVGGPSGVQHTMTSSRWLIWLNGIDMDQTSACLGGSPTLRYPIILRPTTQPSCPDNRSIAHFMLTDQA